MEICNRCRNCTDCIKLTCISYCFDCVHNYPAFCILFIMTSEFLTKEEIDKDIAIIKKVAKK